MENTTQAAQEITANTLDKTHMTVEDYGHSYRSLTQICDSNGLPPPHIDVIVVHLPECARKFAARVVVGRSGKVLFSSTGCDSQADACEEALAQALDMLEDVCVFGVKIPSRRNSSSQTKATQTSPQSARIWEHLQTRKTSTESLINDTQSRDRTDHVAHSRAHGSNVYMVRNLCEASARPLTRFQQESTENSRSVKHKPQSQRGLKRSFSDLEQPERLLPADLKTPAPKAYLDAVTDSSSSSRMQALCQLLRMDTPKTRPIFDQHHQITNYSAYCTHPTYMDLYAIGNTEATAFARFEVALLDRLRYTGYGYLIKLAEDDAAKGVAAKRQKTDDHQAFRSYRDKASDDEEMTDPSQEEGFFVIDTSGDPRLHPNRL